MKQLVFVCQNCKRTIPVENVNIATDLAKCGYCNSIYKASWLSEQFDYNNISVPPNGSSIIIEERVDEVGLYVDRMGWGAAGGFKLVFAIVWIGFITFWTFGAANASIFFALFSIPFWLVGISMIVSIINTANEKQVLVIGRNGIAFKRERPIMPFMFTCSLDDVADIRMADYKPEVANWLSKAEFKLKGERYNSTPIFSPALITGQQTVSFFENTNEAEQDWVIKYLRTKQKQYNA